MAAESSAPGGYIYTDREQLYMLTLSFYLVLIRLCLLCSAVSSHSH